MLLITTTKKTFIIAITSTNVCTFDIFWYRLVIHFSIYLIWWWIVGELIGHLSSADAWTCFIGLSFVRASPARITPSPIVVISPRRSWVSRIVIAGVDVPVTFQACVITIVTSTVARSTVDVSWIAPIVILSSVASLIVVVAPSQVVIYTFAAVVVAIIFPAWTSITISVVVYNTSTLTAVVITMCISARAPITISSTIVVSSLAKNIWGTNDSSDNPLFISFDQIIRWNKNYYISTNKKMQCKQSKHYHKIPFPQGLLWLASSLTYASKYFFFRGYCNPWCSFHQDWLLHCLQLYQRQKLQPEIKCTISTF